MKCGTLDQETWDKACTKQFKYISSTNKQTFKQTKPHCCSQCPVEPYSCIAREGDGMQLPLTIIIAVFCIIAITFLGLGAKLLYQHCFGNLGAFNNIGHTNRRTGVGTEDTPRRTPLSPNRFQYKLQIYVDEDNL